MRRVLPWLAVALAACTGAIGGDAEDDGSHVECAATNPLTVPMQRVNATQFRTVVDDLFGPGLVYDGFPIPLKGYAYSTYNEANLVGGAEVKSIMEVAEQVAIAAVDRVPACATGDETACATTYLTDLARRAFRRDATPEELAILMKLYSDARVDLAYDESVGIAIAGLLQMPHFLYMLEDKPDAGMTIALDGQELAQRMALLYWNDLPDDQLLTDAANGLLDTPEGRVTEAKRMVQDARARVVLSGFVREWLSVKDFKASVHEPALQDALEKELALDVDAALDAPDGIAVLLTSNHTKVNSVLETFYGLSAVSTGPDDWRDVDLDPEQRVGILTHPLVMARFANGLAPSDILRGKFVRMNLLCGVINPPPAGAQQKQAEIAPAGASIREQSQARLNDPVCGACHTLMDPIGFGFSAFDGAGKYLAGQDVHGKIAPPSDNAGDFDGVRQLGERLAVSGEVQACFATQWMRYSLGKTETSDERCSMGLMSDDLAEQSVALMDLFANAAGTVAFASRASEEEP